MKKIILVVAVTLCNVSVKAAQFPTPLEQAMRDQQQRDAQARAAAEQARQRAEAERRAFNDRQNAEIRSWSKR